MNTREPGEMIHAGQGGPEARFLAFLRGAALIAVLAGAAGSFGLMLRVGRRNNSLILLALFTVWVLSPFLALIWAHAASKRWSGLTRATLYPVMLVISFGSLAVYGRVAFGPRKAQPAFAFLMIPLASWLVIAVVVPIAALVFGRLSRRSDGV